MLDPVQVKMHSQKFTFSKYCSEKTFVSSHWAKLNMAITTPQIQASKVFGSSQLSQHFIYLRDVY